MIIIIKEKRLRNTEFRVMENPVSYLSADWFCGRRVGASLWLLCCERGSPGDLSTTGAWGAVEKWVRG